MKKLKPKILIIIFILSFPFDIKAVDWGGVNYKRIESILKAEEGLRYNIYYDTSGIPHFGYGHNIEANPISAAVLDLLLKGRVEEAVNHQLYEDILNSYKAANLIIPCFKKHSRVRQEAMIMMVFQIGAEGVKKFKKALKAMGKFKYYEAAKHFSWSIWAKTNSPKRAKSIIFAVKYGYYPRRVKNFLRGK